MKGEVLDARHRQDEAQLDEAGRTNGSSQPMGPKAGALATRLRAWKTRRDPGLHPVDPFRCVLVLSPGCSVYSSASCLRCRRWPWAPGSTLTLIVRRAPLRHWTLLSSSSSTAAKRKGANNLPVPVPRRFAPVPASRFPHWPRARSSLVAPSIWHSSTPLASGRSVHRGYSACTFLNDACQHSRVVAHGIGFGMSVLSGILT